MTQDITSTDLSGLPQSAMDDWNRAVFGILSHDALAGESLASALHVAPDVAILQAVYGLLSLSSAKKDGERAARTALRNCHEGDVFRSSREKLYVAALATWIDGQPRSAARALETVLIEHPTDILAFKLAQMIRFMCGDRDGLLAAAAAHVNSVGQSPSLAGFAAGCAAFAFEECGDYATAERLGRRAVELEPRDAWGRHAVVHVCEMTGRSRDGLAFIDRDATTWAHCGNFGGHLHWHRALFLMEEHAFDEVLAVYDAAILRVPADDVRDFTNAVSLLVRLDSAGVDVGHRWEDLAAAADQRSEDRRWCFADLHILIALARAGHDAQARSLARALASGMGRIGEDRRVAMTVAAPLATGLLAHFRGDHATAAQSLSSLRQAAVMIGGSNAQRDVFEQLRVLSLARADAAQATEAAKARLARRGGRNAFAEHILGAKRPGRGSEPHSRVGRDRAMH